MKRFRICLLAVVLAVSMLLPGQVFAARRTTGWYYTPYTSGLSISFTDDFHTDLSQFAKVSESYAGISRQSAASVLLDAGDFSMGSPYETVFAEEAPELQVMDKVGYNAIALGASEFSLGADAVKSMLGKRQKNEKKDEAETPAWLAATEPEPAQILCSNVTLDKETAKSVLPYTVLEAGSYRVGLMSLVDPAALEGTGVEAEDPVSAAKKIANKIMDKEPPDILVCMYSGKSGEDFATEKKIAGAVKSISLIISSGSGKQTKEAVKAGNARIVSTGGSDALGTVTFSLQNEKMEFGELTLEELGKDVLDNAEVAEEAAKFKGIYDKAYFKAHGYAYTQKLATLDAPIAAVPDSGSNDPLGAFVADAYRYTASKHGEADVAIISQKALSEIKQIPDGDVETKDLYQMLRAGKGTDGSLGTGITRAYIQGLHLRELVNSGIAAEAGGKAGENQLYFSGIECTYNPHRFGDDKLYGFHIVSQDGKKSSLEADRAYCIILDAKTAETLQTAYKHIWEDVMDAQGKPLEGTGAPVMRDKTHEVKRWGALAAYLKKFGGDEIGAKYAKPVTAVTYDDSKNPTHLFRERGKLLGVFISIGAIILALLILLILFLRGRPGSGRYPSGSHARLQYKRYRKQKERPIFKRRKNRYK